MCKSILLWSQWEFVRKSCDEFRWKIVIFGKKKTGVQIFSTTQETMWLFLSSKSAHITYTHIIYQFLHFHLFHCLCIYFVPQHISLIYFSKSLSSFNIAQYLSLIPLFRYTRTLSLEVTIIIFLFIFIIIIHNVLFIDNNQYNGFYFV